MLGQAKWIPGQLSFSALAPGQTAPYNYQPLIQAGLPLAPYVEHGSWRTGQPDIMRYGRDPYRGIMGLGATRARRRWKVGMGDLLTDLACERSQFAADWRNRFGEAMNTTLVVAVGAAAAAGLIGALTKKPLLGLVAGGVVGWMAHQSQVATYADFLPR